ncbi:hypothetical protein [uncultured Tyzzerella sp.]|uniref:hypothetical protein n=1 Tax=uncultured Tyzzerella sp. TaxID=2321398 RepID=UPI0029429C91|nr:hypothetical protein [uncultured Tyzzerella sp.]
MSLTKIDIIILKDLYKKDKYSFLESLKIKDFLIIEQKVLKENSLYKRLEKLKKLDLVAKGVKDGKSSTYYITSNGIEFIKEY